MGMTVAVDNPLHADLDLINKQIGDLWKNLRGQRIFITGGTGFIGSWLLESLIYADRTYNLGVEVVILTRSPDSVRYKAARLASYPAITLHLGDVCDFTFPAGEFKYIIHGAANPSSRSIPKQQLQTFNTIVEGTRHTLRFAEKCNAQKFLLLSSGAVYGSQPPEMLQIPENFSGAPDCMDSRSAYGEGKRAAEILCMLISRQANFEAKIARCFTFVGGYLPLYKEFAVGNFIRDGVSRKPIHVDGDGTAYRSFLYTADMVVWLWTILFHGKPSYPYNVGSEKPISIAQLAQLVADQFEPKPQVIIAKSPTAGKIPERYIPSTQRAMNELGLCQSVDLVTALQKMIAFTKYQQFMGNQ
jgi:nucleoside-diphosphate-sugar epimerase